MKFNQFFNILLESIINQSKASRAQMLAKVQNHQQIQGVLNELAKLGKVQAKAADFIARFFKSGQLNNINDSRIDKIVNILKRIPNYDTQKAVTLNQFLEQNETYSNRTQVKKDDYLDSIPQFSEKKKYPKGVVIYKVAQTKQGQAAVRKIIDAQWGQRANPWCLASRDGNGLQSNYKSYWLDTYNAFPKHIAFQNGKLLAFCAASTGNCTWWDRGDRSSTKLKLLDGSQIQTQKYYWSDQQLANMFMIKNGLHLNKQTGLYDSEGNVRVKNENITKDGHFPVKFGYISGNFECYDCTNLTSNEGAPIEVRGSINYDGCKNMPGYDQFMKNRFMYVNGLKYNSKTKKYDSHSYVKIYASDLKDGHFPVKFGIVDGGFDCRLCKNLTTLQGAPTEVGGDVYFNGTLITSLKYAPKKVGGGFFCNNCYQLTSLQYAPQEVKGSFKCYKDIKLTSLKGVPKKVKSFDCSYCEQLVSLQGGPEEVTTHYDCSHCKKLESLKGAPKKVGGNFKCIGCRRLKDISGIENSIIGKLRLPPSFEKQEVFVNALKNKFTFDKATGLYNSIKNVVVKRGDLQIVELPQENENGYKSELRFPFPMGTINGNFSVRGTNTNSLVNAPKIVKGDYKLVKTCLHSLKGGPEFVGGTFQWEEHPYYKYGEFSLEGAPKQMKRCNLFISNFLPSLKGLQNCKIKNMFELCSYSVKSLEGMPKQHINTIRLSHCVKITSLKGITQDVDNLKLIYLDGLENLDYLPPTLKYLEIFYCKYITQEMVDKIQQKYPNLEIDYKK